VAQSLFRTTYGISGRYKWVGHSCRKLSLLTMMLFQLSSSPRLSEIVCLLSTTLKDVCRVRLHCRRFHRCPSTRFDRYRCPVRLNSSGGTTVSDILENDTSLPRARWSVLVLCSLPRRLELWGHSIWGGYFGELKGLDLPKLAAEPGVLGGLTDTGGLNSLLKFFDVMGDFG